MLRLSDHLELQRFLQSCHEVWNLGTPRGGLLCPQEATTNRGLEGGRRGGPLPQLYLPKIQLVLWRALERTQGSLFCFVQRNLAVKETPPPLQKGRVVLIVLGVFMREYLGMQP